MQLYNFGQARNGDNVIKKIMYFGVIFKGATKL